MESKVKKKKCSHGIDKQKADNMILQILIVDSKKKNRYISNKVIKFIMKVMKNWKGELNYEEKL